MDVLNGGWKKWIAEGHGTTNDTSTYPRGNVKPRPRPDLMVTKQQVLASLHNEKICILNALAPEVFNGKMQLFPRAGRIPGSKNVYAQALVDPETNAFIDVDKIKALFKGVGALQSEQVITYCGGGIAASGDALALVLIGVDNVSVYDGSMSEWTADPDMPLETGEN